MNYVLLNSVHGDFPASHVFGKEFRPRIEWICVCYKWVALDCFQILGINGQVISTPIGLFFWPKKRINMFHTFKFHDRKKGRKTINIFNCNTRNIHTIHTKCLSTIQQKEINTWLCLRVCSIIDKHIDDPESFPQATPGAPWNPGDSSNRWTWFWGETCPAVFFWQIELCQQKFFVLVVVKVKVDVLISFLRSLLRFFFFEELGLNFGDWRKSGWMMEHNVRNIKRWFWIWKECCLTRGWKIQDCDKVGMESSHTSTALNLYFISATKPPWNEMNLWIWVQVLWFSIQNWLNFTCSNHFPDMSHWF